MDKWRFRHEIRCLDVGIRESETRWLTPRRHPRHRPARDQDVEGHHPTKVGPAPGIVRVDPSRHVDAAVLPDQADAEIEVAVVGAENQLVLGLMAGRDDRPVRLARLEAERPHERVAKAEEHVGPARKGKTPGGGFARREGGMNRVAVEEVSGPVKAPERRGAGEGVGAEGPGGRVTQEASRGKGAFGRGHRRNPFRPTGRGAAGGCRACARDDCHHPDLQRRMAGEECLRSDRRCAS